MSPRGINLGDGAWMCDPSGDADYPDHANARLVYERLSSGTMPPDAPWPAAQTKQFRQWMEAGFGP